ncbi:deoxycytidylate deaminase isoform X1 [Panicum miliaceum]|uniref:dCMP deaminase n=1 Tax=Panicum miliaceum TaxID=4540 RepID=A0A3L6SRP9_PANMI|nr:deoxycytidylate deaminase isoform X1 [Panicum miliaceum]
MSSTRDLAIASISAAAGAVAAAAALRFVSCCRTSSVRPQNLSLAANGSAPERPLGVPLRSRQEGRVRPRCLSCPRWWYISWDDYFMAIAFLSAERCKDPNRQQQSCLCKFLIDAGTCTCVYLLLPEIGNAGIGYNGFPRGCSDDKLPWAKKSAKGDPLETKYPYVVHAEVNAILNTNHASAAGQKLYVTMFPCNECAKIIIQSGVSEVIYFVEKRIDNSADVYVASHKLLSMAGVKVRKHQPQMAQIPIKFQEP